MPMFSGGMEIEVKMKKRKILIAMLSVFIAVFPTACGNPDSSESGNKKPLASFGNLWEMKAGESDGKADILLKEIRSSGNITPAGTVYYLSADGNDKNSGTDESNPWKSVKMLKDTVFEAGDTVLFRRGDTFRGDFTLQSGVTYGTYGTGDKPMIYGSKKNLADAKWEMTDINNVYVCDEFYAKDVGLLVFENGKAVGIKRSGVSDLKENYDFCYDVETRQIKLYCDFGNPSDLFESIEAGMNQTIINGTNISDVTIDGLSIRYGGAHGIGIGNSSNITIRNCEVGWVGGSYQLKTVRYGNCIEFWENARNNTVENCYLYQAYDTGLTNQYIGEPEQPVTVDNLTYCNNLIEYCTMSYEFFLDDNKFPQQSIIKNVTFSNNILRYCGYGWGKQRPDVSAVSHLKSDRICRSQNFLIQNNIFDRSAGYMLNFQAPESESVYPQIEGNTYIQPLDARFAKWNSDEKISFGDGVAEIMKQRGIDSNPTVVYCERESED